MACHSVHKNGPNGLVARQTADINKQCAGCHPDVWASFQRPYGHKLPQNAMSCVDCHNPHGTFEPRLHPDGKRQRAGLPEVPRRHGRAVRLRTRAGQTGRLHGVPSAARLFQPTMLTRSGGPAGSPGMPFQPAGHDAGGQRSPGVGSTGHPRSGLAAFPELHQLPPEGPRIEREPGFVQ